MTNIKSSSQLLRRPAVQQITGLARSTIYSEIAHGRFPKPIRLGSRVVAWLASDIENWITERIADSRPDPLDQATGTDGISQAIHLGPRA